MPLPAQYIIYNENYINICILRQGFYKNIAIFIFNYIRCFIHNKRQDLDIKIG